ncbi:transcriptional adapter 2A isoform X2 [Eupeodes corollae]|uniref:transcriptional adapter 2A isoform X2 n=1 Tax=Eupeodes corollae TaxID=290404 RepID=UPI0024926B8B|nr:transcriptional adapter 2A isoform X2 [Eupeodes corollae]
MSFMNPVDMVEEDAADLQFPKENTIIKDDENIYKDNENDYIKLEPSADTKHTVKYYKPHTPSIHNDLDISHDLCEACNQILEIPHVRCPECLINLCLNCFARGKEIARHRNTHHYIIIHDNIHVFPWSDWTAFEEKLFLRSLQLLGYGNWDDIAKAMRTRTPDECRAHYHECYFDGIFRKLLGLSNEVYFPERTPYLYKFKSVDPPRHEADDPINVKIMAGYRCARGDFDTPYDNSAESIISNLEDLSQWPSAYKYCAEELHCAIVKAYNHRLVERQRRCRIMRDNGLIVASRTLGWIAKYSEALESQNNAGRFLAFMQITNGMKFDMLVEAMSHFTELRKYIFRLYELRKNGVRSLHGGSIYFKQLKRRQQEARNRKSERLKNDWKTLIPDPNSQIPGVCIIPNIFSPNPRKKAAPIDIIGLPGYAKLTQSERDLCSVARIIPAAFMNYKTLLVAENTKIGYLRLADARRLIKIDVNKTRQIYDFLLEEGHINKPT